MTTKRAAIARWLFRLACLFWVALVPVGSILRLSYVRPPWHDVTWELSSGLLALVGVGGALWSGAVTLGYRGVGSRTVLRSDAAHAFWWYIAIGALCGITLVGFGAFHLLDHA